jgi:hypothetical protein
MRLFKCSKLGKAFFLVFGVAQPLHKKTNNLAPQVAILQRKNVDKKFWREQLTDGLCVSGGPQRYDHRIRQDVCTLAGALKSAS